jgi:hypothetical protein
MHALDRFGLISEIRPDQPPSWEERVFLTFDVDWASDAVIGDTIDLVEEAGVGATWFVTHDSPILERLRSNPGFELGIHPNFNFLLEGDGRNGATAAEVLDRLLAVVPEAKAVRSHSMAQTAVLLNLFAERGLTHDCNHFIPGEAGMELRPWRYYNGLIKVPYFWEDDVHCLLDPKPSVTALASQPGLRVFDFHPIHIFLNTETLARYEEARPFMADSVTLLERRGAGCEGARDLLGRLLERG